MSKKVVKKANPAGVRLVPGSKPLAGEEVKTQLQERFGLTLKEWAEGNDFAYDTASCVVRGVHRATRGVGYRIAVQLGMKKVA